MPIHVMIKIGGNEMSKYKKLNECNISNCKNPIWKDGECKKHREGNRDFGGLVPKGSRADGDMGY